MTWARVLGIALSGVRSYDGILQEFPFVNPAGRKSTNADDIDAAIGVLWRAWMVVLGIALVVATL